jgi:hypothetical protein
MPTTTLPRVEEEVKRAHEDGPSERGFDEVEGLLEGPLPGQPDYETGSSAYLQSDAKTELQAENASKFTLATESTAESEPEPAEVTASKVMTGAPAVGPVDADHLEMQEMEMRDSKMQEPADGVEPATNKQKLIKEDSNSVTIDAVAKDFEIDIAAEMTRYSRDELWHFKTIAKFSNPNPRKIKRVTNLYTMCRLLWIPATRDIDEEELATIRAPFLKRLLWWIVMCEQWPARTAMLLQVLEDIRQLQGDDCIDPKMELLEFYQKYVEPYLFADQGTCVLSVWSRFLKVLSLDGDPENFVGLLSEERGLISVNDIGTSSERNPWRLNSYTLNLNPAICEVIQHTFAQWCAALSEAPDASMSRDWWGSTTRCSRSGATASSPRRPSSRTSASRASRTATRSSAR